MMITPENFIKLINQNVKGQDEQSVVLGTIPATYTTGLPTVQFDGESQVSAKQYPYLVSYIPKASDRVMLIKQGHGWIIAGSIATTPQWQTLTLLNGWVSYGGGYSDLQYKKDITGFVHLRALLKSGTTTNGIELTTLPAGYWPQFHENLPIVSVSGTTYMAGVLSINSTTGIATLYNVGNTWLSVSASFYAG